MSEDILIRQTATPSVQTTGAVTVQHTEEGLSTQFRSNKVRYGALCEKYALPIYMQPWWMDAVSAGKEWDVLFSFDAAGEVRAAMPFMLSKKLWMRYITMPNQTRNGGIWLREDITQEEDIQAVCEDMKQGLKELRLSYYAQRFPLNSPCPAVMKKLGFSTRSRKAFVLRELQDIDGVLERFSKQKKQQLQHSLTLQADYQMTEEEFVSFAQECTKQNGKAMPFTREFFLVMYTKAIRSNQAHLLRIRSIEGQTLAAALLIWDERTLYYQNPFYMKALKQSGARELLVWEAIKLARKMGKEFDFGDARPRKRANSYKQFAAEQVPFKKVSKYYNPLFALVKPFLA